MKYTGTFLTAALLAAATPAVPARAAGLRTNEVYRAALELRGDR